MRKALVVGLTGGIASGKSLALKAFARSGAHIISTDEIAREQARPGQPVYRRIVRAFGKEILGSSETIDRKKLGRAAFGSPVLRRRLERLTHPAILKEMRVRMKGARGVVVVDAPLLFEAGLEREFDLTVLIAASRKDQLARLKKRDGLIGRQALARLAAQLPLEAKAAKADVVVVNSGRPSDLTAKIRQYGRALRLMSAGANKDVRGH